MERSLFNNDAFINIMEKEQELGRSGKLAVAALTGVKIPKMDLSYFMQVIDIKMAVVIPGNMVTRNIENYFEQIGKKEE